MLFQYLWKFLRLLLVLIKSLVEKHPQALREKNDRGFTPLHSACCYRASKEVIDFLLNQYPQALQEKSEEGFTPLHDACRYRQSKEVIECLTLHYPGAACIPNSPWIRWRRGWKKPYGHCDQHRVVVNICHFHFACSNQGSDKLIELLTRKYPHAAWEKDDEGCTPLYLAYMSDASTKAIELLISKYQVAFQERDMHGRIPIHYACQFSSEFCVQELVDLLIK